MLTLTRSLLTIVLAIILIAQPVTAANPVNALKSIRALEAYVEMEDGTKTWVPMCTVWRAQTPQGAAWMTAGHCTRHNVPMRIGTVSVRAQKSIFQLDANGIDIAVLAGGPVAPPLALAFSSPSVRTPIMVAGFPHGSDVLHVADGMVGSTKLEEGLALYNVAIMGGISGAPVIDIDSGVVVGMITQSECPTYNWCPFGRGVTVENLRAFLDAGF